MTTHTAPQPYEYDSIRPYLDEEVPAAVSYTHLDKAVNPSSVMGATKRFCEMIVQSLDLAIKRGEVQTTVPTRFATTRFGNVLNSAGSVIPTFKGQLQRGGPLTVTDPRIERYFMTIPAACLLYTSPRLSHSRISLRQVLPPSI